MSSKKAHGGITAADLASQLAEDPSYRRKVEASEAVDQLRAQGLHTAEEPIVESLRAAGVDVSSVWDLVNSASPYPDALSILLAHLTKGGYPDRVMEGLARALAVGPAAPAWEALKDLYLAATGHGEMEGLAVALAASATSDRLDDLIGLLHEVSRGDTRIHLLRAVQRVGGPRGRPVLESLQSDPTFEREIGALLGG